MKKYDCVVVVGCSFMHGDAILDTNGNWNGEKYRMSKLLSDKLNCDEINLAKPGSGNERISRKIYEWVSTNEQYKNPLIIIGLSGITRQELWSSRQSRFFDLHILDFNKGDMVMYNEQLKSRANKLMGSRKHYKLLESYVEAQTQYFFDLDKETDKLEKNISFLDSYLKTNNIDYILLNSIEDNLPNIKNNINYMSFEMTSSVIKDKFSRNDGGDKAHSIENCWYHYLRIEHELEHGDFNPIHRSPKEPYGKYFCNGHPSPEANKELTELIYKKLQTI